MTGWKCKNCGHVTDEKTENLQELSFKWYDEHTCKTSCPNCGTYTLNRATDYNEMSMPIAGYFLVVKSFNKIRKGTRKK